MIEYFRIGKLVAAHGVSGEFILKHGLGKKTSLKGIKAIYLEDRRDSFLPWFIHSAKARGEDEVLLVLETIDTREKALKLLQKEVWLPEAEFLSLKAKNSPMQLLGYLVVDQGKPLAPILEVIEQPHQLLCRIELQGKEVLVPLHEQSILRIDHKKKQVEVNLPEGLVELYLGN